MVQQHDRIVSVSQPHVRPIVRGKARTPVEFGAKLSLSCVNGCVCLERVSWENFNESTHLQHQVDAVRRRFGSYPQSVHADQIYRTQANRRWCKARGICLSGLPLGRPQQDPQVQAHLKQQARDDKKVWVQIEDKFGQAKGRFGLNRVMAKLADTAESAIAITFLVMNLERWLSHFLLFFLVCACFCWRALWSFQDFLGAFLSQEEGYCSGHHNSREEFPIFVACAT